MGKFRSSLNGAFPDYGTVPALRWDPLLCKDYLDKHVQEKQERFEEFGFLRWLENVKRYGRQLGIGSLSGYDLYYQIRAGENPFGEQ